eukprot:scaffold118822_cov75-Phaeocystis_antarctica.AAC.3
MQYACNAHAMHMQCACCGPASPSKQLGQSLVVVLLHGEPEAGAADELVLRQSGHDLLVAHGQRRVGRAGTLVVLVVQLRANAQDVLDDAQVPLASSRDERRRGVAWALLVRRAPAGQGGFQLVEVARAGKVHDHLWSAHPCAPRPSARGGWKSERDRTVTTRKRGERAALIFLCVGGPRWVVSGGCSSFVRSAFAAARYR